MKELLEAKTMFYGALIAGCRNTFIEHMLRPLHDRITVLRITSMSQANRVHQSLREVKGIIRAIESGDTTLAEKRCIQHVEAAAKVALEMIKARDAADLNGSQRRGIHHYDPNLRSPSTG